MSIKKNFARKEIDRLQREIVVHEDYALKHPTTYSTDAFNLEFCILMEKLQAQKLIFERCLLVQDGDGGMGYKDSVKQKLSRSFLREAHIMFSTLSGAGHKMLNEIDRGFDRYSNYLNSASCLVV